VIIRTLREPFRLSTRKKVVLDTGAIMFSISEIGRCPSISIQCKNVEHDRPAFSIDSLAHVVDFDLIKEAGREKKKKEKEKEKEKKKIRRLTSKMIFDLLYSYCSSNSSLQLGMSFEYQSSQREQNY
jgi:hypothetical protein